MHRRVEIIARTHPGKTIAAIFVFAAFLTLATIALAMAAVN